MNQKGALLIILGLLFFVVGCAPEQPLPDCAEIVDVYAQSECYSARAALQNSVRECNDASNPPHCYAAYAVQKNEWGSCELLDAVSRDTCYNRIAQFTGNGQACELIQSQTLLEQCQADVLSIDIDFDDE